MDKEAKVLTIITIILGLLIIGLQIYVLVEYGERPITEIPAWAVPFFVK